jgi:hypothetical protein
VSELSGAVRIAGDSEDATARVAGRLLLKILGEA